MAIAGAAVTFPFLTAYDPPGSSEGTLDPLGFYQIADQLAVQLVPSVRERMLRARFLTAMAVGALVTEDIDADPDKPDAAPYLVWEWLLVESMVRTRDSNDEIWGVPGTQVARSALRNHGYLDARSYLKTPRIFGFNGVYKRLAIHLGLVDLHLAPGPNAERVVDAWARDLGFDGLAAARPKLATWAGGIRRSLAEKPARTRPTWGEPGTAELAEAFLPDGAKAKEKRSLRDLLLQGGESTLGALPHLWKLQAEFKSDDEFREEALHDRLEAVEPAYGPLLAAIRSYEAFARSLQDAFDILKAEAATLDSRGFTVPEIASDSEFRSCAEGLKDRFRAAHQALGEVNLVKVSAQGLLAERFGAFSEPMEPAVLALRLCTHHEAIQRAKSLEGKLPWFDRLGPERIRVRQSYREARRASAPGRYLHTYRGWPVRRFQADLS